MTQPEILSLILGRRSVRVYSPGTVTDEHIHRLLEAAMAAPSAMTKDPWRFIVIRRLQTLTQLAAILPGGKMLSTASAAVLVCGAQDVAFEQHESFLLQDCSAAIENLLLCAHGLGLGACWVGAHPLQEACREIKKLLNLPPPFVPVAAISLGFPGEQLAPRTRYNDAYVRHETWS